MAIEKDPLGDKLAKKERAEEDRFFKERDEALLERLRKGKEPAPTAGTGRCPKDGTALVPFQLSGVTIEECPTCKGTWLERGELETIAQREHDSWLGRLFYAPRR